MFGLVLKLGSSTRNQKICYSIAREFLKKIKHVKGRKTQLIEKKSSKNSTISKKQAYQRKSVQYESNLGISLIENGNPSNGYALRSRKSDFVRFGEESDSSSVNIATPKFDCILTPALPKKTPRFQDCISPTELLLARKNAEEYLYRRNKKRKSGNEAAVSVTENNKTIGNSVQDVPEKKKLDFKEAINKLNSIQKKLEQEDGDEEEDTYFSDVSD
ncbi:uncharacterized protein NPIL_61211 [Nephila pilipes]|uniref:Uncharacterized protein n=1 Tax=Nephila pilipes TaxID=299642 RepID=A0A8X6TVA4_NEPPI|nr:uncharacterized protein NPIL_61211 [Nephila pilipes]